ncbi:hypothetical protein ACODHD_13795 [Vagococcus fluvialis]|uniref:hypothetical protein n=1 Tax=Vagococcus fluvialis TaxID=2738 RepID=UPI003B5C77C2
MSRSKSIKELKEQFLKEVFSVFVGMDDEYKQIIGAYNKAKFIEAGTYSEEYLQQLRGETVGKVHNLMSSRKALAMDKLAQIDEEYTPQPEPTPLPTTTEEKILMQLERNNNLMQVKARIESSEDKRKAYREIYDEFKNDEFVLQYLDNVSHGLKEYDREMIKSELDNATSNPFATEVNKIRLSLNTLLSEVSTMYPSYLDTGIDKELGSIMTFRNIAGDIDNRDNYREGWRTKWNTPHRN